MKLGAAVFLIALIFGLSSDGRAQSPPADQADLIERLGSDDRHVRFGAVDAARNLAVEQISPQLGAALIQALQKEAQIFARQRRGEVGFVEFPELIARLAWVVSDLRNPSAIPALAGALGTSPPAVDALARFGGIAAKPIMDVLRNDPNGAVGHDGLIALRLIVEGTGQVPLTPSAREEIREFSAWFFQGRRQATPLRMAIDLAIALDDRDLRQTVELLANDENAVRALGITRSDRIREVQEHAAARLAGAPARPACCPPR